MIKAPVRVQNSNTSQTSTNILRADRKGLQGGKSLEGETLMTMIIMLEGMAQDRGLVEETRKIVLEIEIMILVPVLSSVIIYPISEARATLEAPETEEQLLKLGEIEEMIQDLELFPDRQEGITTPLFLD